MSRIHLPAELVLLILEQAYYDRRGFPDWHTLSACARVCTSWRPLAQRLLFHQVVVPGIHQTSSTRESFRSTVLSTSDGGRELASYIRRVDVTIRGPEDEDNLVQLINHCHHLYELVLRASGVHALRDVTMHALGSPLVIDRPTPIRALFLSCGIQSPILYQLLAVWPTIQFLRIGTELAALPPKTLETKAKLYELVLYRLPSVRAMEWMLSASDGSLRILECQVVPDARYDTILDAHTRHLQSLRVFHQTLRSRTFIHKCVNLQELMLAQLSRFLPLGELPETLEHVAFRQLPGVSDAISTSIISAVDKLPRLRLMSCDASARQSEHYPALEEKCRKKRVLLDHNMVPIQQVSSLRVCGRRPPKLNNSLLPCKVRGSHSFV